MNSKKDKNNDRTNLFFHEAERWENLEYAYSTIKMMIQSELEKGVGIEHFLQKSSEIFSSMELEQFFISKIIAWGATISIRHRKIWIENMTECAKYVLSTFFIGEMLMGTFNEEAFMNEFYNHTQEGILGNIKVINIATMKKECMGYYEIAYQNHMEYADEHKEDDVDLIVKETEEFKRLDINLRKFEKIPDTIPVIRVNFLGMQESQVFDAEHDCDEKNAIMKSTYQEMAAYIFLVENEIFIVNIDDPW